MSRINDVPKRSRFGGNVRERVFTAAALGAIGVLSFAWKGNLTQKMPAPPPLARTELKGQPRSAISVGKLPLTFERNVGQTDARVRFLSRSPGYSLFLTGHEAVLSVAGIGRHSAKTPVLPCGGANFRGFAALLNPRQGPKPDYASDQLSHRVSGLSAPAAFRMGLAGANPAAVVTGLEELPGKSNYFIGNEPAKWRRNVPTYAKVKYQDVYPGIDLVYYGNPQQLEYDFIVAPGADPGAISLNVAALASPAEGGLQRPLVVDSSGDLVIQTGENDLRLHKPLVYQSGGGTTRYPVDGHYVLKGGDQVAFAIGSYDPDKLLVIDPVLTYSTYLGGSGNDRGDSIAVDPLGSAYVTGLALSTDFPPDNSMPGSPDGANASPGNSPGVFVTKLTRDGSAIVYSAYLSGDAGGVGSGIAVDRSGSAYVTGFTESDNFPTVNPLQSYRGRVDAFLAKLDPSGSALLYSTYLGGGGGDYARAIAVDVSGSAYVIGDTGSTDFPTANPLQSQSGGQGDLFVAKLDPAGAALEYSTYLGGSMMDYGAGIAVDPSGSAYVTGETASPDFPVLNPVQMFAGLGSGPDVFVAKLDPSGSALVYSTYLGGENTDSGQAIAVDASGSAYVTGMTASVSFPTVHSLQLFNRGPGCCFTDAFVVKLTPDGSALVYSTYLGGSSAEEGSGIAVDAWGQAYIAGSTTSINFPTTNPLQATLGGDSDGFVSKLTADGSALVYSTYLGGRKSDDGYAIAVDSSAHAYVTGSTTSIEFPTGHAMQSLFGGGSDGFVAKIVSENPGEPFGDAPHAIPGRIEAEDYDLGGPGRGYVDTTPGNEQGFSPYRADDVDLKASHEGGYAVGWFAAGEWLAYTVDVAQKGPYALRVRVGSALPGRTFHVEVNGVDATGPIPVPLVSDWDRYRTVRVPGLALNAGRQVLRVVMGPEDFMDLQWLSLTRQLSAPFGGAPHRIPGLIEAEDYDLGGQGFGYLDSTPGNEQGRSPYRDDDVDIKVSQEGGYAVGWFAADEWLAYTIDVAQTGLYTIRARVGSALPGRTFHVEVDGRDVSGPVPVPQEGDWDHYDLVSIDGVPLSSGRQKLRVIMGPEDFMDFQWLRVDQAPGVAGDRTLDISYLPMAEQELVVIRKFSNRIDAEVARSVLKAAKIMSYINGEDPGMRAPVFLPVRIELVVRASDAEEAALLLGPE